MSDLRFKTFILVHEKDKPITIDFRAVVAVGPIEAFEYIKDRGLQQCEGTRLLLINGQWLTVRGPHKTIEEEWKAALAQ